MLEALPYWQEMPPAVARAISWRRANQRLGGPAQLASFKRMIDYTLKGHDIAPSGSLKGLTLQFLPHFPLGLDYGILSIAFLLAHRRCSFRTELTR
jgi:hypothetical protein